MPNAFVSEDRSSSVVAIYVLKVPSENHYSNENEVLHNASFLSNGYLMKDSLLGSMVSVKVVGVGH
jgi:hypothetical protein